MTIFLADGRVTRGERVKRLEITAEVLVALLGQMNGHRLLESHGLPKDARVVGAEVRPGMWPPRFLVYVESNEFPEIGGYDTPANFEVNVGYWDLDGLVPEDTITDECGERFGDRVIQALEDHKGGSA